MLIHRFSCLWSPQLTIIGNRNIPWTECYVTLMGFRMYSSPFFLLFFMSWLGACVLLLRLVLVSHTCPGVWDNKLTASFQEAAVSDGHRTNALQRKVSVAPGYRCWTAGIAAATRWAHWLWTPVVTYTDQIITFEVCYDLLTDNGAYAVSESLNQWCIGIFHSSATSWCRAHKCVYQSGPKIMPIAAISNT